MLRELGAVLLIGYLIVPATGGVQHLLVAKFEKGKTAAENAEYCKSAKTALDQSVVTIGQASYKATYQCEPVPGKP